MKQAALFSGALVAGLLLGTVATRAHHSFALFDMNKEVTYEGKVVEYKWMNPHAHITIVVPATGKDPQIAGTWDVEGGSINIMTRQGWTRATFKYGDRITVVGHPMKDGSKGISLFYAVMPDGKRLYHDIARPKADE